MWNAEYKETTAKNDLAVDCVDRTPSIPKEWQDVFKDVDDFIFQDVPPGAPFIILLFINSIRLYGVIIFSLIEKK